MRNGFAVVCATLLFAAGALGQSVPKTLVLDGALLEKHRAEHAAGKNSRAGDIVSLIKTADKILKAGKTYSVTKKITNSTERNQERLHEPRALLVA